MLFEIERGHRWAWKMRWKRCLPGRRCSDCRRASIFLILSDRGVNANNAPIPGAVGDGRAAPSSDPRERLRTQVALVVESGEPREVHHFALLIGYGATAINPYLAYETIREMIDQGLIDRYRRRKGRHINTSKPGLKGVVKVLSKMGISTLQSYCGAQIFEALGLSQALVDKYFTWTPNADRRHWSGADLRRSRKIRHRRAFPSANRRTAMCCIAGGQYQWRAEGERHLFNPQTIHKLQYATRTASYTIFKEYSALVNAQEKEFCTLRALLDFKFADQADSD